MKLKHYLQTNGINGVKIKPLPGRRFTEEEKQTACALIQRFPHRITLDSSGSYIQAFVPDYTHYDALVEFIESQFTKPQTKAQKHKIKQQARKARALSERQASEQHTLTTHADLVQKALAFFGEDNWLSAETINQAGIVRFLADEDKEPRFLLNRRLQMAAKERAISNIEDLKKSILAS